VPFVSHGWLRLLPVLGCVVLGVVLAGCTTAPVPPASGDDGTEMVIAVAAEPAVLHPLAGYAPFGAAKVYQGLVERTRSGAVRPALATEAPRPAADGRSWTVRLRPGVSFSDGSPFDAADVAATYTALLDPAYAAPVRSRFAMLAKAVAVDVETVRFDLSRPNPTFDQLLTLGIVPSTALEQRRPVTEATDSAPVGTGPYRLTEWRRGDRAVFEVNRSYSGDTPRVAKLTVEFIADESVRAARMRAGTLDGTVLPVAVAAGFDDVAGVDVSTHTAADLRAVRFGPADPVTADQAVRTALNLAVDRAAVVADALGGHGRAADTPMPDALAEFVEPGGGFAPNPALAAQLLQKAGWLLGADGVRTGPAGRAAFTLGHPREDSTAGALARKFAEQAAAVGVEVTVRPTDPAVPVPATQAELVAFGEPFDPAGTGLAAEPATTDPAERASVYRAGQRAYLAAPSMVVLAAVDHGYVLRRSWNGYLPVTDAADAGLAWGAWWNVDTWTPR